MKIKTLAVWSCALMLLLASCSKEDKAPSLTDLYGPAEVLSGITISNETPDFSLNQTTKISATFATPVTWILTLTGDVSGAVKTFKGASSSMDVFWNGSADGPGSFRAEPVTVNLIFPYSAEDNLSDDLTITAIGNYNTSIVNVHTFSDASDLVFDYPTTSLQTIYATGNLEHAIDAGGGMKMTSVSNGSNNFHGYIGMSAADIVGQNSFPLYADPGKVYFNIAVYNPGPPNTRIQVVLLENGADARTFDIVPNWVGWKQLSVNYKDFTPKTENIIDNPQRITGIALLLFSQSTTTDTVHFVFDNINFTNGAPYRP